MQIVEAIHGVLEKHSSGTGCGYRGQRYRPDRRRKPAARSGRADCGAHRHQYDDGRRSDDRSSHRNRQICRISGRIQRVIPSEPLNRNIDAKRIENRNIARIITRSPILWATFCVQDACWCGWRRGAAYIITTAEKTVDTAERICNTHYLPQQRERIYRF